MIILPVTKTHGQRIYKVVKPNQTFKLGGFLFILEYCYILFDIGRVTRGTNSLSKKFSSMSSQDHATWALKLEKNIRCT
jgi:hypothetical protein